MGLCKKCRVVTDLFCFEHKTNVCDKCLLDNHSRCVVRTFMNWLQDCEFDPTCGICKEGLDKKQVVRLTCMDLFHTDCLDQRYVKQKVIY